MNTSLPTIMLNIIPVRLVKLFTHVLYVSKLLLEDDKEEYCTCYISKILVPIVHV